VPSSPPKTPFLLVTRLYWIGKSKGKSNKDLIIVLCFFVDRISRIRPSVKLVKLLQVMTVRTTTGILKLDVYIYATGILKLEMFIYAT